MTDAESERHDCRRLQPRPGRRHRLRDRDRRAGQGRRRPALPRRRHRGPGRPGHVRQRLGAARRRQVRARACRRPSRSRSRCTPATFGSTSRPRWRCCRRSGATARCWTSATSEARDQLARAAVMALSYVAQSARGLSDAGGAAVAHRPVHDHRRAVHDPLARRAGPAAHQGRRRLLRLGRRARHERLDLHRAGHRLHRRRRRRRDVRRHRRDERTAARRRPGPRAADDRGGGANRRRAPRW